MAKHIKKITKEFVLRNVLVLIFLIIVILIIYKKYQIQNLIY